MKRPQLSDAEWKVMNAVWGRRGPVTARQVLESVGDETAWAYTTVKTLMDRLVDKGVLRAVTASHTTQYRPRIHRARALRAAARALADKAFGGSVGPLVHFLIRSESLSRGERQELRRMLADDRSAADGAPRADGPSPGRAAGTG